VYENRSFLTKMLSGREQDIAEVRISHLSEDVVPFDHVSALALEADTCSAFQVVSRFEELDLDNNIVGLAGLDSLLGLDGSNVIRVLSDDNDALRLDAVSLVLLHYLDFQLVTINLGVESLEVFKNDAG